jgi:separase
MTTSTKSIAKKNLGQQINRARDRLEGGFEKSMLSLWVNSSVSLGLAELYASQMMLSFSLSSAKDCIKYCQLGMKESRKMRGDQIDGASLSLLLPKLFSERKVTCLLHMSSIHDALGSYRKAEAYLLTALTQSGIGFSSRIDRLDLQSVSILCREVENVQQMLGYRAVVALKAQLHSYPKLKAALWKAIDSRDKNFDPHDDLELSLGRIQLISDFVSRIDLGSIVAEETQLINQAFEVVTRCDLVVSNDFVSSFLPSGGIALDRNIFSNVIGEVTLCQVQLLLLECQGSSIVKAEEMCNNVLATSTNATLKCRAHNYLGLIRLMAARESGSLLLVWSESLPLTDDLIAAADHFEAALELVDSLDFVSKREISRSLALSLGPNHRSKRLGLSSDALIFSSIGVAMTVKLFDTAGDEQGSERSLGIAEIFGTAQSELPPEWRIVSAALCSTGELLVASLKNGESECACVFPARYQDKMFDSSIYDFMMSPLDELIQRSERQLNGMDEAKISVKYSDASSKRDWWSKREELDEGLDDLLGRVHSVYFGNSRIGSIFGGMECNEDETSVLSPNGNLETKFDAAFDLNSDRGMNADECTILLLDENLHRFPWEGLPFLRGKPITRVPSLSFLSSRARNYSRHKVDATNARYVLDPESNLGHTTGRIMPFIECVNERTGWSWSGVVGEFPSDEFVAESLARENGMFLYCGHGGGKGTFSKSKIDSLVNENHMLPFQATVILMGCSSGKLESVNRKEGEAFKSVPIHYEPEGIALSYILAGAPCVVGNLWDVTDRDIDRFCLTLLGSFLSNGDASLARCLANARSSCKMQHIVGLAPVCYGIPVYLMDDMQTSSSG